MNNNPQNDANQLKIELSPEVVEGVYSNLAVLTHSSAEFIFDFVRVLPGSAWINGYYYRLKDEELPLELLTRLEESR